MLMIIRFSRRRRARDKRQAIYVMPPPTFSDAAFFDATYHFFYFLDFSRFRYFTFAIRAETGRCVAHATPLLLSHTLRLFYDCLIFTSWQRVDYAPLLLRFRRG